MDKHWADRFILRDLFWFLVLPYQLQQDIKANPSKYSKDAP